MHVKQKNVKERKILGVLKFRHFIKFPIVMYFRSLEFLTHRFLGLIVYIVIVVVQMLDSAVYSVQVRHDQDGQMLDEPLKKKILAVTTVTIFTLSKHVTIVRLSRGLYWG